MLMLYFLTGCGGAVEQTPEAAGGTGSSTGDTASNSSGSTNSSSAKKVRLGNCKPGTPLAKTTDCLWLAEDTCYPTREAACNCTCPLDVDSVYCMSDFPEEGIPAEVYCL